MKDNFKLYLEKYFLEEFEQKETEISQDEIDLFWLKLMSFFGMLLITNDDFKASELMSKIKRDNSEDNIFVDFFTSEDFFAGKEALRDKLKRIFIHGKIDLNVFKLYLKSLILDKQFEPSQIILKNIKDFINSKDYVKPIKDTFRIFKRMFPVEFKKFKNRYILNNENF